MPTGLGLIVLAAIFAFGVLLFGLFAIMLLPGAVLLEDALAVFRSRRRASGSRVDAP
jgi:hypothetical protein